MKSNPPRAGPSLTGNPYSKLFQGNEAGNVLVEESEGVGSQGLAESGKPKAESGKFRCCSFMTKRSIFPLNDVKISELMR